MAQPGRAQQQPTQLLEFGGFRVLLRQRQL